MDPILPFGTTVNPNTPAYFPGVFENLQDKDALLASLDSDTRDYVVKHTDEFSSRSDVIDCVNQLHKGS